MQYVDGMLHTIKNPVRNQFSQDHKRYALSGSEAAFFSPVDALHQHEVFVQFHPDIME